MCIMRVEVSENSDFACLSNIKNQISHNFVKKNCFFFAPSTQPPTVACKMEAQSEHVRVSHTFLPRFGGDSHAQSVLSNEISASGLKRKFIKGALFGWVVRQKKGERTVSSPALSCGIEGSSY